MASTKLAFGDVLGALSSTANTLTTTVGIVNKAATYADNYLTEALVEQTIRQEYNKKSLQQTCRAEVAAKLSDQARDINKAKAKDAVWAADFDSYFAMLGATE